VPPEGMIFCEHSACLVISGEWKRMRLSTAVFKH
jgi:hypothetical protein